MTIPKREWDKISKDISLLSNVEKTSMEIIKSKGKRGQPYLRPLEEWKKPLISPFKIIEKGTFDIQAFIHLMEVMVNSLGYNLYSKEPWLIE